MGKIFAAGAVTCTICGKRIEDNVYVLHVPNGRKWLARLEPRHLRCDLDAARDKTQGEDKECSEFRRIVIHA